MSAKPVARGRAERGRTTRRLLLAAAVVLAAACSRSQAPDDTEIDLAALLDLARVTQRAEHLALGLGTDRTPLVEGWSVNEKSGIWCLGGQSVLRFARYEPGAIRGEIAGRSYSEAASPSQNVTVLVNGHEAAVVVMSSSVETHRFVLPERDLAIGENLLTLRPSYSKPAVSPFARAKEYRPLSIQLTRIRLVPEGRERPIEPVPTIRLDNGTILQQAGTEFSYEILTGNGPALHATLELASAGPPMRPEAAVSVLWRDEPGGAERILREESIAALQARSREESGPSPLAIALPPRSRGRLVLRLTGEATELRWTSLLYRDSGRAIVPPSFILAVVDALRQDHIGYHGYSRDTSPNLDRLAAESVVFLRHVSQAPWTPPSFGTLLTGELPHVHRAGFISKDPKRYSLRQLPDSLSPSVPTLAEILGRRGYATSIRYANPLLDVGLLRGFEQAGFPPAHPDPAAADAEDLVGQAIRFAWKQALIGRPFFVVLGFMDTHEPLHPREDSLVFSPLFPQEPGVDLARWKGLEFLVPPYDDKAKRMMEGKIALYDDAIRFVDSQIGRLANRAKGLSPQVPITLIVTADHGEEFWDHAEEERAESLGPKSPWGISHGHSLYGELLLVPLLIWHNRGIPPRRVESLTEAIDIAPTILAMAGAEGDASSMPGRDLLALSAPGAPEGREHFAFSEFTAYGYEKKSIQSSRWKLIFTPFLGKAELYDLEQDPREKTDLAGERKDKVRELLALLREMGSQPPAAPGAAPPPFTKEQEENLRALGYVD